MKNCKEPNNGGNVLILKEGKLILMDQSANEISSVDLPDTSTKLDVSAAEAEYAHSLSLDGSTLKLMNHKDSPEVLSSVDLPTAGGASIHAHAVSCVLSDKNAELVSTIAEYIADGVRVEAAQTDDNGYVAFNVILTDPTKFVFSTSKPVFYRVSLERNHKFVIQGTDPDHSSYGGVLVTPADSTSNIYIKYLRNFGLYSSQCRAIVEVFAELVEAQ